MIPVNQSQRAEVILEDLLRSDLGFKAQKENHVLHNTHAFAAKFHPSIPRLFIEALTEPGEVVLDPMCGSGTALIEAALSNRTGIGLDFDPLAVKLSRMKISRLDPLKVKTLLYQIVNNAFVSTLASPVPINQFLQAQYSEEVLNFFRYWFREESMLQLACLIQEIKKIEEAIPRNFFEVIFSSIILSNGGGVSLARDLMHARPQRHDKKRPRDAIKFFLEKGTHALKSLQEFWGAPGHASVVMGDSRNLPFEDNSADLIITSPPCANGIGEVLAHRYSLYWLGVDYYSLAIRHDDYIGAQVIRNETQVLQQDTSEIIPDIGRADRQTGSILGQYFQDMAYALSEMHRVLKPGKSAVLVMRPSTVRWITVPTHEIVSAMSESMGFQWVGMRAAGTEYDPGLIPVSQDRNGNGVPDRKDQEYIMGLVKES